MSGSGRRKKYGGLRTAKRRFSAFGGARALARGMMLQGLGRKRRVRRRRVGGRKMVGGFLKSIFNKVKDVVTGVPILSTGARLLGHPVAGNVLRTVGLGRKRVRRGGFMKGFMGAIPLALNRGLGRRRKRVHRGGASIFGGRKRVHRGRGIMDMLKKAHKFVKDRQLISKGLNLLQDPRAQKASSIAGILGYGRKVRRTGGARRVGGRKRKGVSLKKLIMGGSVFGGARPSFMKPRRRGLLLGSRKF
jgi:hypothetical protein